MKTLRNALISLAICAAGCSISRPPAASHVSEIPPGEVWLTQQQVKDAHLEIEPVTDRPVGGTVHAAGRVTFDDLRVGHVFSPVTGRITKILAQPGQRVTKGQGLCVIQSPDMGSAISDMAKAQASLFQAERDWRRQKDLLELHAAAQRDYEMAESAYLNAKAEMERAETKARLLRNAGLDAVTQEYVLPSPIAGEVIMRGANPGLELQGQYSGGSAVELFTIGELDRVWVLADVYEMDLPSPHQERELRRPSMCALLPRREFQRRRGMDFGGARSHLAHCQGALLDRQSRREAATGDVRNRGDHRRPRPEVRGQTVCSFCFSSGSSPSSLRKSARPQRGQLRFERRADCG